MELLQNKTAEIIQKNGLKDLSHGLLHGNAGLCIFFYQLARQTNNADYEKFADDLLDKVFANLSTSTPADFEYGLAGIGWSIEYLVQNNFAEGNTDEILEDVDNKVYRILNEEYNSSFELGNGLTGYLFYLISRLRSKEKTLPMAQCINRELLILAINKLDEMVISQFAGIVKEMNFDLFWRFPVMLHSLTEAFKLNIYNAKICCIIRQLLPNIEANIPSLHINRLYLAVALKGVCSLIPDKRLEKQAKILLYATDFEALKTEIDHTLLNIRYGWPGIVWLLKVASQEIPVDWPNHQLIIKTYHEIMERHENPLADFLINIPVNCEPNGLALGLSGIGLIELLWPGVLSDI